MLDLLDYRRQVFEMYRVIRVSDDFSAARDYFQHHKDELFRSHAQSPLDADQKSRFEGLSYFPYDPAFRVIGQVQPVSDSQTFMVDVGDDGQFSYTRFAQVSFNLPTGSGKLSLFWVNGYGGGVFLPFGDATNRTETYGAGRYLYDSIKGADLGGNQLHLVLDFNFAYNPSCAYNSRWVCPLAPPENRLSFPVPAGEKVFTDATS